MSEGSWLVLPTESAVLREALWNGSIEHEGRRRRAVPRELIVEGDRRKVLLLLEEPVALQVSFWRRWGFAFRVGRASLILLASAWVFLFGWGQGWIWRPLETALAVAGVLALHLAVNAFAEVHDTLRLLDLARWYGPDRESSAILEGWVTPRRLWAVAWILLAVAAACGLPLLWWNSHALLPMATMGALAVWGYAQPPLALKYRGWGELVLFLAAGPALSLGLSWCMFGKWNLSIVSLGFCLGLWTVAFHLVGNLPDADRDQAHGVATLATRLGFLRARWLVPVLYFLGWVSFFPAMMMEGLSPLLVFALAVILVPQALLSLRVLRASGSASVWMAGIRRRVRWVHWISHWGALALTGACLFLLGGLI